MKNKFEPFWVEYGVQGEIREHLDHVIVNTPTFEPGAVFPEQVSALDYRLGELTSYFTHFSFRIAPGSVITADSIDDALQKSTKDFCLIQNYGHLFYGAGLLSEAIKEEMNNCQFLTGHIMEKGGYYYLHNQCILVNRRAWEALGRPIFGTPKQIPEVKDVGVADRSREDIHDDYTPTYLNPTDRTHPTEATFGYGWNAISKALQNGLSVRNWSDLVRKNKRFCYAYYGRLQEWLDALNDIRNAPDTDDEMLSQIVSFLRNTPDRHDAPKKIFLFNTEHDVDIPNLYFSKGIDRAFLLASGFKGNRILDKVGIGPNTQIVIYDYSEPSLKFRQMMIEEWDGKNFYAFVLAALEKLSQSFGTTVQVIPQELLHDQSAMEREFQREVIDYFGSEEQWLSHWNQYRKLPHSFEHVDLVGQPFDTRKLLSRHAQGNCLIWLSDMYDSPNAIGKFGHNYRILSYSEILNNCRIYADSVCIIGGPDASWSWI